MRNPEEFSWGYPEPVQGLAASPSGSQDDAVARLEKAEAMLDKGLISDAEFEALKARIVNTL